MTYNILQIIFMKSYGRLELSYREAAYLYTTHAYSKHFKPKIMKDTFTET